MYDTPTDIFLATILVGFFAAGVAITVGSAISIMIIVFAEIANLAMRLIK